MLKIGIVTLIGLAVLGWLVLNPGQLFDTDPPPIIRADAGPVKHRPNGYVAARNSAWATPISFRQNRQAAQDASAIEINLLLAR